MLSVHLSSACGTEKLFLAPRSHMILQGLGAPRRGGRFCNKPYLTPSVPPHSPQYPSMPPLSCKNNRCSYLHPTMRSDLLCSQNRSPKDQRPKSGKFFYTFFLLLFIVFYLHPQTIAPQGVSKWGPGGSGFSTGDKFFSRIEGTIKCQTHPDPPSISSLKQRPSLTQSAVLPLAFCA